METPRNILSDLEQNIEESMGARSHQLRPNLAPVADGKYVGRKPHRNTGKLDLGQVIADANQPRMDFAEESLDNLAESILRKGQLQPIRVRWSAEHDKWIVVAGERRWRAAKLAGLSEVDCVFIEDELSQAEVLEEQIIENTHRENFKPVEEAKAFAKLVELNGWTGKQLAAELRLPESKVSRALALLKLPTEVQQLVESGTIPARSAYELTKLSDTATIRRLADDVANASLTCQQTTKAVRQRRGKRKAKPRKTRLTFPTENGWKIVVTGAKNATYFDIEQALLLVLEEVRTRIDSNVQLL